MASVREERKYSVNSIERAAAFLDLLAERSDLSFAEIQRELDLSKSTAYNIAKTLERLGFVEKNSHTRRFRLGLKLLGLGSVVLARTDLRQLARPIMLELAEDSCETSHLAVRDRDEAVYIEKVEGPSPIKLASFVGQRVPLYCTSVGKVLAAYLPDQETENIMERMSFAPRTGRTRTSPHQFREAVAAVRTLGYAIDDGENEEGVRCIGAPIRDHTGSVVAAMSLSGPTSRITDQRLSSLIPALKTASAEISNRLGYRTGN